MNVKERLAVLSAKLHNANARIDRLHYPRTILEHVERLREEAVRLVNEADRVESELKADAAIVSDLIADRVEIEIEYKLLEKLDRAGLREISSAYVSNFVLRCQGRENAE